MTLKSFYFCMTLKSFYFCMQILMNVPITMEGVLKDVLTLLVPSSAFLHLHSQLLVT